MMATLIHLPPTFRTGIRLFSNALIILILIISTTGCATLDEIKNALGFGQSTVDRTLKIIDDGIARMDNESADWQSVLQDMQSKLTDDTQSIIRNEINTLMLRSVEAVSTNVKCIIDMTRARVLKDLYRIRAEFLGYPVPDSEPHICTAIPTAIDMSLPANERNIIELYGFDFDTTPAVEVFLVDGDQTRDVSQYLDRPTHYLMTLNLGSAGIPLNTNSQKIRLTWNDREISTIAVLQTFTPVCEIKPDEKRTPAAFSIPLVPNSGDELFGDTRIFVYVELIKRGDAILAYTEWYAKETTGDLTTAEGYIEREIINPPAGWAIYSIDSPLTDRLDYLDGDLAPDEYSGGGPVGLFQVMADQGGDDPGRSIKRNYQVDITYNEIRYTLIQTGNCVDPNDVVEAAGNDQLSSATIERMVEFVPSESWRILSPEELKLVEPYLFKQAATSTPATGSNFQIAPTSTPATGSGFRIAPTSTP